jgi:DNA-binding MarR family transcriptional regulator
MYLEVTAMRIEDVLRTASTDSLTPMQRKVLDYLEGHADEVFPYQDGELARILGLKPAALGFTLWSLERKGAIKRIKVDKFYFGCEKAVSALQRKLSNIQADEAKETPVWKV